MEASEVQASILSEDTKRNYCFIWCLYNKFTRCYCHPFLQHQRLCHVLSCWLVSPLTPTRHNPALHNLSLFNSSAVDEIKVSLHLKAWKKRNAIFSYTSYLSHQTCFYIFAFIYVHNICFPVWHTRRVNLNARQLEIGCISLVLVDPVSWQTHWLLPFGLLQWLPLPTPFLSPLYDCDLFNSSCLGLLAWGSWSRSSLHHPNIELQTRVCLSVLSSPSGTG